MIIGCFVTKMRMGNYIIFELNNNNFPVGIISYIIENNILYNGEYKRKEIPQK